MWHARIHVEVPMPTLHSIRGEAEPGPYSGQRKELGGGLDPGRGGPHLAPYFPCVVSTYLLSKPASSAIGGCIKEKRG